MISLYKKYERWVPIFFFFLGFLFDLAVLKRIDEPLVIVQQAIYLLVSAILIGVELIETTRDVHPPWIFKGIWKYREPVLHFLMGTLLNSFTIFYFKSASALTSFLFIFLLIAVLIMNEFKRFGERQTQVHVAFLSLCLISYLVSLAPILLGFIGIWPFLGAWPNRISRLTQLEWVFRATVWSVDRIAAVGANGLAVVEGAGALGWFLVFVLVCRLHQNH